MESFLRSRVPWEAGPNLKELAEEVGVNMDSFVDSIGANKSDVEMAEEFDISEKTVAHLKEHFFRKGLGTTIGQD
jgi:hypothetical protein